MRNAKSHRKGIDPVRWLFSVLSARVIGIVRIFADMAYNNRNTLLKMVRVQDIVLREKRKGVSQIYVYEHLVKDAFLISYSTFNRWLAYPAKQELKSGKRIGQVDHRQLSFGFQSD